MTRTVWLRICPGLSRGESSGLTEYGRRSGAVCERAIAQLTTVVQTLAVRPAVGAERAGVVIPEHDRGQCGCSGDRRRRKVAVPPAVPGAIRRYGARAGGACRDRLERQAARDRHRCEVRQGVPGSELARPTVAPALSGAAGGEPAGVGPAAR